jgi:hypothetical protein
VPGVAGVAGEVFIASDTSNVIESILDRDVAVSSDSSSETVSGRWEAGSFKPAPCWRIISSIERAADRIFCGVGAVGAVWGRETIAWRT